MGIDTSIALTIVILAAAAAGATVARRRTPPRQEPAWPAMLLGGLLGAALATAVFMVLLGVTGLLFFFSGPPNPYVLMGLTLLVVLAATASLLERAT